MKTNRQEAQRVREPQLHELRSISSSQLPVAESQSASPVTAPASNWFRKLSQWAATRSEPRITAITAPSGQTWWRAYNPQTHELKWLDSEAEVMGWLEVQPCC